MNCPYCDEGIHPGSKFCPKCGLPLKEDSTVMGAYVSDGPSFNPWVIGGGGLAIVALALGISWMNGRKEKAPAPTVRREPVANYSASGGGYGSSAYGGYGQSQMPSYRGATLAAPPFTPNIPVRWAYTPPARPARQMVYLPLNDPQPPPVPLRQITVLERRERTSVSQPRPVRPEIPIAPPVRIPLTEEVSAGIGLGAGGDSGFGEPAVRPGSPDSQWVWDPVHEQWARRPDWRPRRQTAAPNAARNGFYNRANQDRGGITSRRDAAPVFDVAPPAPEVEPAAEPVSE